MTGDIILQRRSGIAGWFVSLFTKSEWVHVGIDIGDQRIIHVDWLGKRLTHRDDWADDVLILIPTVPLTHEQQLRLWLYAHSERVKGYSFWHAIKSHFWKSADDESKSGQFNQCAEFVSRIYRLIGIDLVPNRSDDTTQPQDFLESPVLTPVVVLGKEN